VAQENHHLTTEQFSAHLDGQLSDLEQSQLNAHLKTCVQCQQELTDLRRTVALLHALPRPALPRSFVLPLDIQQSAGDHREDEDIVEEADHAPIALMAARARRSETSAGMPPRRRWPTYVRTALRTVSAIAAVIGFVLFLSGVFTTLPHGGATTSASTASQANVPRVSSNATEAARVTTGSSTNNKGAEPQISPSSRATIIPQTPTSGTRATATIGRAIRTPIPASQPKPTYSAESTSSQMPTILFFDLSSGPGRLGFGFLLLLLGVMGYVVFKRRRQQERA
jgi:anti-sigma factor RsiW